VEIWTCLRHTPVVSHPRSAKAKPARRKFRPLLLAGLALGIATGMAWFIFKTNRMVTHGDATAGTSSFGLTDQAKTFATYGGSASCRECHEEEYAAWAGSHHGLAERAPSTAMDEAAFVPARTFKHETQQTSVRKNGGRYEIIDIGLHGTNEVFPVQRVIGDNPLRQMLVEFPGGRLQTTEAAWDPRLNEWFDMYGTEDRKPGEWGHWTGRGMNWNNMCAVCHNTRLRKNYDVPTDTYHTAMVENGVGCEACHGPMKDHNQWQAANKGKGLKDPTLRKLTRQQTFDTCAGCHSRRAEITGDPKPGDSFFDHHLLTIVDDSSTFYPDGQNWDEDYEVTAFMGSRMFHKGVRCMDCHNSHTMKTRLPGNFLCLSCHGPGATNAPVINPVTHSRHNVFGYDTNGVLTNTDLMAYKPAQVKETGGECVNCHMPQTPYMQRHWRHDHGFTIPDPLLTKQFGIPNACNRCHADKSTDWSLGYVEKWYGDQMNRPYRQHAEVVARARQGDAAVREPLVKMLETDEIPYWQAVAANMLQRWVSDASVSDALLRQLQNTNPLVRQMAVQALGPVAQAGRSDVVSAMELKLNDPSRNVRMEAARQLAATLDTNSLAGSEYLYFLNHVADQPLGQLQAGTFRLQRGDPTNALPYFERAAAWDPYSAGIRHELAMVLSQLGRMPEAVTQLEAAVRLDPSDAEFHYKLALALNETGDTARVLTELEAAVKCDPHHARAWYNLGLARSGQGDDNGALEALLRAETAAPDDPRIPYARATVLARLGNVTEARTAARRALALQPNFPAAAELLQRLGGQ
jgi:tetratricopeptide (TPR) repeat protein